MDAKTPREEMMTAREAILAVLDEKIGRLPEWKAFRAIDRACRAQESEPHPIAKLAALTRRSKTKRLPASGATPSYMKLAADAIAQSGHPVTTNEILNYIGARRPFSGDVTRAKVTVQSSLSKDDKFKSVSWDGGRGWWYADRPIPSRQKETAA